MIIQTKAYPRAGLVGNPSDGYYGKTMSFTFGNFEAEVTLYESPELEILPAVRDHSVFSGVRQLVEDVKLYGYYGGVRLLKAAIKKFYDYCMEQGIGIDDRNFTMRYRSSIPHQVGLAGSSAIITACFRALMAFYGVTIPRPALAARILAVEKEELGIAAGLQDRVAQTYQGLVYMDFDRALMEKQGYGRYENIDPSVLPPVYIAYRTELSEDSGVYHSNLRTRYEQGDPEVLRAIDRWAALTDDVREYLRAGRGREIGPLLNENFDLRRKLSPLSPGNLQMVETARSVGASAKFPGSGGAIVGTYADDAMFETLKKEMNKLNIAVIRPDIVTGPGA